jgi:predicted porin
MKLKPMVTIAGLVMAAVMSAAQADVTLFGHIDTSIDATDQDGGSDDVNFNCTTCSVGFKGKEDLGNGLAAIFKLDFQYDTINRNSNGSITDRDQWLGLAGNFGQVRIGTISTHYKSHGAMLDPLYRTSLQGRDRGLQSNLHRGAGEEGQGRADNTLRYDTPSWNGLKAGFHYTLDSDENDGPLKNPGAVPGDPDFGDRYKEDDNPYGVGLSYENGGILVFADYITTDTGGDDSAWKVGGKYTLNNLALMAQYEKDKGLISSKTPDTTGDGADLWQLGASFTMGNNMLYFGYGNSSSGSDGSDAPSDYFAWTVAGVHHMSKRTSVYAGFSEIDCDDPDEDVCDKVGDSGGEDDKFSIGMKHKF